MKNIFKVRYIQIILLFTLFNACYLAFLNLFAGNHKYNFLCWNLFLGFVPFLIAFFVRIYLPKIGLFATIFGSFLWLLFYPNSPYMVTDLIHVDQNSETVLYEALMIFSFAMQSLFFGFYSLKLMREILRLKFNKIIAESIITFSIALSSFGIYLGRILRLNSWDVFTKPLETLKIILDHLFPVTKNPTTYVIIILFTLIQLLLLASIRDLEEI